MRANIKTQADKCQKINAKRKNDREQLKNWYVRSLFVRGTGLKAADIPESVIECKKLHIKLKRAIKKRQEHEMLQRESELKARLEEEEKLRKRQE